MASQQIFTGAVEGAVDDVVVRAAVEDLGLGIGTVYVTNGKENLIRRFPGFNDAAEFAPWIVVIDLDGARCAPELLVTFPPRKAYMRLRVAVRAIESWLIADRDRIAAFLGISTSRVPTNPDAERNPKHVMVNLARHSRRRAIREDMVPRRGSGKSVGPAYVARLIEYVLAEEGWRPSAAETVSDSLRRCRDALR